MTYQKNIWLLFFVLSCRVELTPPPPPTVTVKFAVADINGLPPFGESAFPDDQYRDEDGTVASVPGMDKVVTNNEQILSLSLDGTSGFGLTSAIYFFTDGLLDPKSFPQSPEASVLPDSNVFVQEVDLTAGTAGEKIPIEVAFLPETQALVLLPRSGTVLQEGTSYVAVVSRQVTAVGAESIPDEDFTRLFDGSALSPAEEAVSTRLQGALGLVGKSPESVLCATVFTTGRPVSELQAAAEEIRQNTPPRISLDPGDPTIAPFTVASFAKTFDPNDPANHPSLKGTLDDLLGDPSNAPDGVDFPGLDNSPGLAHDSIGLMVTGVFFGPNFQRPDNKTDGLDDETFDVVGGVPQVIEAERPLPFTLLMPDPALAPMPANGYPVVIATHGLGNSRRFLLAFANQFTRQGIAVIGIDLSGHGSRFDPADTANSFFPNGVYQGPDGLGDNQGNALDGPPIRLFEGFTNLLAARDNLRQSALDLVALHRAISSGIDLSGFSSVLGGANLAIDGSQIAYLGNSLGTIVGTLFLALTPEVQVAALNVAGAGFANNIVAHSADIGGQLFSLAILFVFGSTNSPEALDRFHPLLNLAQEVFDATDPMAFARLVNDRQLLLLEVIDDETMPNQSSRALAEALGLDLLGPVGTNALVEEERLATFDAGAVATANQGPLTRLLMQIAPATHSDNLERRFGTRNNPPGLPLEGVLPSERFPALEAPFEIEQPIRAVQATLARFFTTGFTGSAEVLAIPPVEDFDADGFCDADEETQSTDPLDPTSSPSGQGLCVRELP